MKTLISRLLIVSLLLFLSACATVRQSHDALVPPVPVRFEITKVAVALPASRIDLPDLAVVLPAVSRPNINLKLHERANVVLSQAEIQCLADVIYFESKSEPEIGQIGVGYVVLNRMGHKAYPKSACGVAYDRKHGCQFDWACKGRVSAARHARLYEASRKVAMDVMEGRVPNPIGDSIQFRQARLRAPRGMTRTATLHGHSFYAASL